ncbi:Peptidyl-tRNA hydrolase type 2 [Spraguea lophii 42_110]|uniref:peptidyl-tRNA hydrolase n=1 Tax=Spraguea lophii (strain 42_110) TaxID=1358809 RepID=S7WAZ1_SPRLO|nr:Peptidyl-tRNA hydrolase type 2 [Spraguea lophii 42_110]
MINLFCIVTFSFLLFSFFKKHTDNIIIFIVNNTLKMGKGKAMAQVCHAAVNIKRENTPKLVLKAEEYQLRDIVVKAKQMKIPVYRVYDAGRTQVPAGSNTIVALGPDDRSKINILTNELKLY